MLRFLTAGESHGQGLIVVLEGMPAGLPIDTQQIDGALRRRQTGYGRGRRMQIESDRAEVVSGVRRGETLGSPIAMTIRNKDWDNWRHTMSTGAQPDPDVGGSHRPALTRPRPGHADLAGAAKYDRTDIRDVLERASARETAARVAAGALAAQLLTRFDIHLVNHVTAINGIGPPDPLTITFEQARDISPDSPLRCVDTDVEQQMIREIDRMRDAGNTAGGSFEVIVRGLPPGLGSHVQWDRKLDGRLGQAILSIPAIKGVGIGLGPVVAARPGSRVHDEILQAPDSQNQTPLGLLRPTNHAGGLEGGVTNGEDLRVTGYMKPIATLMTPLRSIDLTTMTEAPATVERSDVCAVPAAAVVGEAMVALVLADAFLDKFGGDSISEIARNLEGYLAQLRQRFTKSTQP